MPRLPPSQDRPSVPVPGAGADAREYGEYEAFVQDNDPLDIEAATWAVRRRSGLDAAGEAELQAWLDEDPRHREAFDDMDGTLGEVERLPDDEVASLKASAATASIAMPSTATPSSGAPSSGSPARIPANPPTRPARRASRPWLPGLGALWPHAVTAVIAFALVGGGWMGWDHWQRLPVFEKHYATARGQQLSVQLPDGPVGTGASGVASSGAGSGASGGASDGVAPHASGSRLQLDTATRLDASLYRDRREVRLQEGQAMFTVQAEAERPFHVWAGPLRITVVGTRFSVRHTVSGLDAGQTVVSVEEGRVRVARIDRAEAGREAGGTGFVPGDREVLLTAGQKVVADSDGQLGLVGRLAPAAVAPWRDGRLSFDQTPLAQAIAEFERYGRTGLVVRDPAVAALPVGGSYSLRQWQRFAETLPQVLPVRLVRHGDVTEVVAR